jgi:hypothetical protein
MKNTALFVCLIMVGSFSYGMNNFVKPEELNGLTLHAVSDEELATARSQGLVSNTEIKKNHLLFRAQTKIEPAVIQELFSAIDNEDIEKIDAIFSKFSVPYARSFVNLRIEDGRTPLIFASNLGKTQMIRNLISKGAAVNYFDPATGSTALHASIGGPLDESTTVEVVKELVRGGADINAHNVKMPTPLIQAILRKKASVVRWLLENGADVKIRAGNSTPLEVAFLTHNSDLANLILRHAPGLLGDLRAEQYDEKVLSGKPSRLIVKHRFGCWNCKSLAELMTCAGCRAAFYCSRACQKSDWPAHKGECKQLKAEVEMLKAGPKELD